MKKLFYLSLALLFHLTLYADTPIQFNYQALLRDADGSIIENQNVAVNIKILKGAADGKEVFTETHNTSTNDFGLVNLKIGSLTSMENINWGSDDYFIAVMVNGTLMGATQLLSVPYALHAQTAENISGEINEADPVFTSHFKIDGAEDGDILVYDVSESAWKPLKAGRDGETLRMINGKIRWVDFDTGNPTLITLPQGEYNFFVKGGATALNEIDSKGMLLPALNSSQNNQSTEGFYEIFIAINSSEAGFNIIAINEENEEIKLGPGPDFSLVATNDLHSDEPKNGVWKGAIDINNNPFRMPEVGLYHIVIYNIPYTPAIAIAKVDWGIIGSATPGGWGSNTVMTTTFNLDSMTFTVEDVAMDAGEFKFRYSNGWMIYMDAPTNIISVNTYFGKAVDDLEVGGANIANTEPGVYKFTMKWTAGDAYEATMEKTGDLAPDPEYPEAIYLVGAASAYGWTEPGTATDADEALMHKIAGGANNEGVFWKIAHLEEGAAFRLSAANWKEPNLGHGQITEFDAEGVAVTNVEGNMSVATSGMYMIVLDLREDQVKVSVKPAAVYGIGDAFGGWDTGVEANKFVVDNTAKTITSPALPAAGNIRMYAAHSWIPAWWNAEFNVFSGKIEYRNDGGDQNVVSGTTGQTITLFFDSNIGVVAK